MFYLLRPLAQTNLITNLPVYRTLSPNKIFQDFSSIILLRYIQASAEESKISEFSLIIMKSSIGKGGFIDKQGFWKMKKLITPRSEEIPCFLLDKHNFLMDPATIGNEYLPEFK